MKVLWFSNTPANGDEYLNGELKITGGWLKTLDKAIQEKVELHVAFYSHQKEAFKFGQTFYHPIKKDKNWFVKFRKDIFSEAASKQDIELYLGVINAVNPDIIHIHGTERTFLYVQTYVNIPVVVSIQGNLTVYLHKYFAGIEKKYLRWFKHPFNLNTLIQKIHRHYSYLKFVKKHKAEEKNLKNSKYVMGRTDWDYRITRILAKDSKYYKDYRVLRETFYKLEWKPFKRDKKIIHTTSGAVFYKGFETLCQALHELNTIGINVEWRVAGISEDDLIVKITKSKLKKKYPRHGLIFLGKLNEEDLGKALMGSDIYVMPSHIENNVNSLCEAMMIGMPCIATYVGGVGSLIKDQEEGLLIQSGDPWAMAGAILELVNDNESAVRFGKNARKAALIRHNKDAIVLELINNYKEIIRLHTLAEKADQCC